MIKLYFVKFSWDGGHSFRLYRVWFFENMINRLKESISELEKSGKRGIFLESIEVVK